MTKNIQKVTFFITEPNGKTAIHQMNDFLDNPQNNSNQLLTTLSF